MHSISRISVQLPTRMTAPGIARRLVRKTCRGLSEELTDVAALLTSELVTDSVLRGWLYVDRPGGAITLRVRRDATSLRIEVHDRSGEPTVGMGQAIVASLAADWGSTWRPSAGTVVWFVLDAEPASDGGPDEQGLARPFSPDARSLPVRERPGLTRVPRQRAPS